MTAPVAEEVATAETVAGLKARIAELERENTNLRKSLADCRKARAEQERRERWQQRLITNRQLSASDRIVAAYIVNSQPDVDTDEDGEASATDGVPDTARVVYLGTADEPHSMAHQAGLSPQTCSDSLKRLAKAGAIKLYSHKAPSKVTGQSVTRLSVLPTAELLRAPEKIAPEVPRNHGGKRYHCTACGSEDIVIRTRTQHICRACASVLEDKTTEREANAPDPAPDEEIAAPSAPACPPPISQVDLQGVPETDAELPWYVSEPWHDVSRPDAPLSQALEWVCDGNIVQASAWLASQRLRNRWYGGATIISPKGGPLDPRAFTYWLREAYEEGRYQEVVLVAKSLGAQHERVLYAMQQQQTTATATAER